MSLVTSLLENLYPTVGGFATICHLQLSQVMLPVMSLLRNLYQDKIVEVSLREWNLSPVKVLYNQTQKVRSLLYRFFTIVPRQIHMEKSPSTYTMEVCSTLHSIHLFLVTLLVTSLLENLYRYTIGSLCDIETFQPKKDMYKANGSWPTRWYKGSRYYRFFIVVWSYVAIGKSIHQYNWWRYTVQ